MTFLIAILWFPVIVEIPLTSKILIFWMPTLLISTGLAYIFYSSYRYTVPRLRYYGLNALRVLGLLLFSVALPMVVVPYIEYIKTPPNEGGLVLTEQILYSRIAMIRVLFAAWPLVLIGNLLIYGILSVKYELRARDQKKEHKDY